MGYFDTGFGFHAAFSRRPDKRRTDWWSETLVHDVILAPVRDSGDLETATHFSRNQKKPVAITSPQQLARAAATWKHDVVQLFAGDADDPTWALHYRGAVKGPEIGLLIKEARDPALRERFAAWVGAWSRGLAKAGCDLTVGYLAPFGRTYPRPRPPLEGTTWPLGQLELYLGRRWHELKEPRRSVLARLGEARLVPGVRRTKKGDVVRISFACDLRDDAAVARARTRGDRWLTPLVPTSPEAG